MRFKDKIMVEGGAEEKWFNSGIRDSIKSCLFCFKTI